jgi:HSP20 family protein
MASDLIRFVHALFLPAASPFRHEGWQPSADVYRTQDGWLVKFDVAGVRAEDIQVKVDGRYLTVRGTRRDWCVEEGCQHYTMEISYSQFERSIALPVDLGRARLATEYRHGMLLVRIQKEAP